MNNKETSFAHKLSDQVNIKRWRATGIVVARTLTKAAQAVGIVMKRCPRLPIMLTRAPVLKSRKL